MQPPIAYMRFIYVCDFEMSLKRETKNSSLIAKLCAIEKERERGGREGNIFSRDFIFNKPLKLTVFKPHTLWSRRSRK